MTHELQKEALATGVPPATMPGRRVSVYVLDPVIVAPDAKHQDNACRSYRQIALDAQASASPWIAVTDDVAKAEVVIVPASETAFGPKFQRLRRSSFYRLAKQKAIAYSTGKTFPLPGLYTACTEFWKSSGWALPSHYRSDHFPRWDFSAAERKVSRDLLFSFVGEFRNHPVRKQVGALCHPRGFVLDPSPGSQRWWDRSWDEQRPFNARFREYLLRSKFVLCPRGIVPNSIRIYEAMEAGAVPILIADGIVLPRGPAWDQFAITVREQDVASIPAILESNESRAVEMGVAARAAWEAYFSPTTSFQSLVRWAAEIQHNVTTRRLMLPRVRVRLDGFLSAKSIRRNLSRLKLRISGQSRL